MLDVQSVAMLLSLNEGELIKEMLSGVMAAPQMVGLLKGNSRLKAHLQNHLDNWSRGLQDLLQGEPLPPELAREFELYMEARRTSPDTFDAQLPRLLGKLEGVSGFWDHAPALLARLQESSPANRQDLFLERWRSHLVLRVMQLAMTLADRERERLLDELEHRMKISDEVADELQLQQPGSLWDLSRARLSRGDSRLLRHYARLLQNNPDLKKIADELGRSARDDSLHQEKYALVDTQIMALEQQEQMPDDLVGIYQDNQLTRLVPSETLLLSTPELETLFFQHLIERRLLNYQYSGQASQPQPARVIRRSQGEHQEPKGPFIVCIDTSGSMSGYPEQSAKALCMGLLRIALQEERECIIMLFSTDVLSYHLTGPSGLQEAVNFLGRSFKGGTDLAPCMDKVLTEMANSHYSNADAIVISDFIAQRLPDETRALVAKQKEQGNRFNGVCLSRHGKPALMKIFDQVWRFDTSLGGRLLRRLH